jgi:polyhydroxyalkanoate synthesis regulator protein
VTDNATGEDLTLQTLTKVILDDHAGGQGRLTPQFLHEVVRSSGKAVGQLQNGLDRLWRASLDRVVHLRDIRQEVAGLRERLESLETQIANLEEQDGNDTDRSTR